MERLPKFGIWVGISAIVFFSAIFAIAMSDNIADSMIRTFLDKDKILNEMKTSPSVLLFAEKFPDHYVQEHKNRHNVSLELFDYNFETGNKLRLNVNFDPWDDQFREHIRCDVSDNRYRSSLGLHSDFALSSGNLQYPQAFLNEGRAEDAFVLDFIKYTNCLEIGSEDDPVKKVSIPEYGDIPTYTISIPEGSAVPGCEEIAHCFEPEEITIKVGDIIEWKNYDDAMHTVTSGGPMDGPSGIFDSGLAEPDATYALKFEAPGEYPYFCMVHPWQTGMITVTE